jgi:hypothetical protein
MRALLAGACLALWGSVDAFFQPLPMAMSGSPHEPRHSRQDVLRSAVGVMGGVLGAGALQVRWPHGGESDVMWVWLNSLDFTE